MYSKPAKTKRVFCRACCAQRITSTNCFESPLFEKQKGISPKTREELAALTRLTGEHKSEILSIVKQALLTSVVWKGRLAWRNKVYF